MFTGIIKGLCSVIKIQHDEGIMILHISLPHELSLNIENGASIAVNGVCLTVVDTYKIENSTGVIFQIMSETLSKTNLEKLKIGNLVNIERALKMGDEFGGHQVLGHVDCVGIIKSIEITPNNKKVYISFSLGWGKYVVPKGWIALDGVSLTVVDVTEETLSVCLIPETLKRTTLGFKESGHLINIEFDHQTKVIVHTVENILPTMISKFTQNC